MTMLETHEKAVSGASPLFHEFLGRYKKNMRSVYGFVEGKDDPSFYRGAIEWALPQGWVIDLWPAGNKWRVLQLYEEYDWSRFPKKQITFFIDRDLSLFLSENLPNCKNVYITDNYAIDNDIVCRNTCERVLLEVCNLIRISKDEKDEILNLFTSQLCIFQDLMTPIMAWVIHWRRHGEKPSLDNIRMDDLFTVKAGVICTTDSPKGLSGYKEYIHHQCGIEFLPNIDITPVMTEFQSLDGQRKFIRGKYLLWFLVQFILSIHTDICSFSSIVSTPPKMNVSMGYQNAVVIVAPRAPIPKSLKQFLKRTFVKYARGHKEAPIPV